MTKKSLKKVIFGLFSAMSVLSCGIISSATTSTSSTSSTTSSIFTFVLLGVMLVLMYFLMIRPQKKKEKEAKEMRDTLKPGDKIVTIGGIVGKVCTVKDDTVTIETGADKIRIKFLKTAIANVERPKASSEKEPNKEEKETKAE